MYQKLSKTYNILAVSIAVALIIFTIKKFYHNSDLLVHPDLFINYEGGFIRRGFDGQILFWLSNFFQINFISIVKIYASFALLAFFIAILILKFKKNIPSFVLFSMSVLLLYFSYLDKGVRKDHIIFLFIILQSLFFTKNKIFTHFWGKISFVILNIAGTLIHEIFFILTIFPVIIGFWILSKNNFLQFLKYLLLIIPSLFLFISLITVFSGNLVQVEKIINTYKDLDYNLDYLKLLFTKTFYFWDQNYNLKNVILFFLMLFINVIFIFTSLYTLFENSQRKLYFIILLALEVLVLLLLCMIAIDYSRIVFFSFFTVIIYTYQYKLNKSTQKIRLIETVDHFIQKFKYLPFVLFFFITMPHSHWNGMNDVKKYNVWVQLKNKFLKE